MNYIAFFFYAISTFFIFSADRHTFVLGEKEEQGTRRCPGGYAHGTLVDRGHYWYQCTNGQLVPKGCLTENNARIGVLETYDSKNVRLQCVVSSEGYLSFAYKSCISDGRAREVGETWEEGKYWYECKKDNTGNGLSTERRGCVDQGRRLNFDERVTKGDFVFVCKEKVDSNPSSAMSTQGCVKDGRNYNLGETFEISDRWYVCSNGGAKCVGCMHNGQRLKNNDRFFVDDVIYECMVDGEQNTRIEAYGCIQRENGVVIERKLGCSWVEGQAPYQYEFTCKSNSQAKTAVKVPTNCVYKNYNVSPGCFQLKEKTVVACVRESGDVKTQIFQTSDVDDVLAKGLRLC
jgi:hypothetical protein